MFLVAVVFSVKTGLEQPKTPESFKSIVLSMNVLWRHRHVSTKKHFCLAFAKIINENVKAQPKHLYQISHPLLTFLK